MDSRVIAERCFASTPHGGFRYRAEDYQRDGSSILVAWRSYRVEPFAREIPIGEKPVA